MAMGTGAGGPACAIRDSSWQALSCSRNIRRAIRDSPGQKPVQSRPYGTIRRRW